MPFLNLSYNFLIYEDQSDRNPQIRLPDITKDIQGVGAENDKSERIILYPGDTTSIISTSRLLSWTSATELEFERFLTNNDNIRIKWTGTGPNPIFRSNRSIGGDATSTVSITRVTPYVARITNVSGTAWSLGSVINGDYIRFEDDTDLFTSPFSETNKGKTYKIQNIGANYIDFIDNGASALDSLIVLGADFANAIKVYSSGPVKTGDTINISGSGINPSNVGKFTVIDVTHDYIEITNPLGVAETVLYGSNNLVIYEYLIGFIHLRASGSLKIKFDNQAEWAQLARLGSESLLISSACAYNLQAYNDGLEPIVISVQHAAIV